MQVTGVTATRYLSEDSESGGNSGARVPLHGLAGGNCRPRRRQVVAPALRGKGSTDE
jgi:hypothetical protein